MPACALTISASAQKATPFAVGQRAPLAPHDETARVLVHRSRELPDETALADARHANERDELRRALALDARESLEQDFELLTAPDELGAPALRDVDAIAGASLERLPHGDRFGLPLRLTGSQSR